MKFCDKPDWYKHPARKFCLVAQCTGCGVFVRDTHIEEQFPRAKYGEGIAKLNNGWSWNFSGKCGICNQKRCCLLCGKNGTKKNIYTRNDVYGWNLESKTDYKTKSIDLLCMSCWNKVKAVVKKRDEADQFSAQVKRFQRQLSKLNGGRNGKTSDNCTEKRAGINGVAVDNYGRGDQQRGGI